MVDRARSLTAKQHGPAIGPTVKIIRIRSSVSVVYQRRFVVTQIVIMASSGGRTPSLRVVLGKGQGKETEPLRFAVAALKVAMASLRLMLSKHARCTDTIGEFRKEVRKAENVHLSKQTVTIFISRGLLPPRPVSSARRKDDRLYRQRSRKCLFDRTYTR